MIFSLIHFCPRGHTSRRLGYRARNAASGQTHPVRVAGKPGCRSLGRILYISYSIHGCGGMTLYGYARVSVREPEDKNLGLQVERLVRAGCAMGNFRAEEANGAKGHRGGLLVVRNFVVIATASDW